jgi:hypothetical protein
MLGSEIKGSLIRTRPAETEEAVPTIGRGRRGKRSLCPRSDVNSSLREGRDSFLLQGAQLRSNSCPHQPRSPLATIRANTGVDVATHYITGPIGFRRRR